MNKLYKFIKTPRGSIAAIVTITLFLGFVVFLWWMKFTSYIIAFIVAFFCGLIIVYGLEIISYGNDGSAQGKTVQDKKSDRQAQIVIGIVAIILLGLCSWSGRWWP